MPIALDLMLEYIPRLFRRLFWIFRTSKDACCTKVLELKKLFNLINENRHIFVCNCIVTLGNESHFFTRIAACLVNYKLPWKRILVLICHSFGNLFEIHFNIFYITAKGGISITFGLALDFFCFFFHANVRWPFYRCKNLQLPISKVITRLKRQ